jgi:hypothetical protein
MRSRIFLIIGTLAVIVVVILGITRRQAQTGRVWSEEHGHWHDQ